jgi:mannose-6-phosphate isomerase-like protein (cupin superfamily)
MESIVPTKLSSQSFTASEGPAFWFLNNLCVVKATTESTGGAFSMTHQISPPGSATPYHLHHVEDEAFYVLDGEYTFICSGDKTDLALEDISSFLEEFPMEYVSAVLCQRPC